MFCGCYKLFPQLFRTKKVNFFFEPPQLQNYLGFKILDPKTIVYMHKTTPWHVSGHFGGFWAYFFGYNVFLQSFQPELVFKKVLYEI